MKPSASEKKMMLMGSLPKEMTEVSTHPLNVGNVVGHAADNVAPPSGIEVGDGQDGDMVVDIVAQAHGDAVAHGADDKLRRIAAGVGE